MGYDVKILKDHLRFVEIVINRDGEMGGIMPLYFDGETNSFFELPLPDDPKMQDWYNYAKKQNEERRKQRIFFVINKIINRINGITKS